MAIRPVSGGSPLRFDSNKYRPEDFIIPGQDQNGNSIREFCRVVPLLDRAMDVIQGSRKFPFRTKGDLMRWCIKTGVERLDKMEPIAGSVLAQCEAMLGILRDEELNHAFLTVFHTMVATIGMHVQAQALGEARRVIATMQGQIQRMQDGYWRTRYLKELDDKFGHLMRGHEAGMGEFMDGAHEVDEDE